MVGVQPRAGAGLTVQPTRPTRRATTGRTWPVGRTGDHDGNCDLRLCDQTARAWWNTWRLPFAQRALLRRGSASLQNVLWAGFGSA